MGCTTLFEYLSGMTLGIDELFVMDVRNQESSAFPGRMAPNAALSLCILGMALFLLDGKNWLNRFAQRLALLSGAIGVFALFGYLFDAHGLYQIFHFVRISPYSAATVVLLSIGVLAARPRYGIIKIILSREASGLFARRMLLAAFISPTLLAFSAEIAESRGYVDAPTALAVVALFTFLIFVMIVWQSAAAMSASETALTESELQFRMVANSIPQLAWMADSTGYITWYNQRWYDYTGTTLEQMRGWGWKAVHDAAHAARVMEKWRAHVESGESWEDTFPLKAADGSYRWFLSRADPLRNNEGVITHWFGTNTDITETLQSRDMAEKANLAKRNFLPICRTKYELP
jgi:PAS domain S-box-containing protein